MTRSETDLTETAARLRHTTTRLFRAMRRQSDVGLTLSQLACLATVSRQGPMPIGALADEEQIARPTATKVVDKLCAAGYLERADDPTDRRVSLVSTTEAGRHLLDDVRARRTAWLTKHLAELPDTDFDALLTALDVLEHLTASALPRPQTPKTSPSQDSQ